MLRTIVVGSDEDLDSRLRSLFRDTGRLGLIRTVREYPTRANLERMLRAHAPQVVFLCMDNLEAAIEVRNGIEHTVPGLPVVAFGRNTTQQVLLEVMRVGVREFMPLPFNPQSLIELSGRLEEHLAKEPLTFDATDLMFSFLPAKPGVGTSTLALNLSVAMSNYTKVLLADFDLNSGLIAFMLKVSSPYYLVDAAEKSAELDENLWPQLVTEVGRLHVLPSGPPEPGVRIEPVQIQRIVDFVRRQYDVITVDLSGNMEKYAIELMQESKQIFLVTTPEIPPLHLARERYNFLRQIDLGDRVSVLLNRYARRGAVNTNQIEDLLEAPVYETFPNRYHEVHKALVSGRPVDPDSDVGQRCNSLAERILNPGRSGGRRRKRRFLEHFSVLPGR